METSRKSLKTAILCISDVYLSRGLQLKKFYEARGDEVRVYTPDYSHRHKTRIDTPIKGVTYLPHRPYQKNLSWQRLAGHAQFARECRSEMEKWQPDRIHALIPANSLAREMAGYKRLHPQVKLYFDIIDLWPESLPVEWFQKTPAAVLWRHQRNPYLKYADELFTECALFSQVIHEQTGLNPEVLYWTIEDHQESIGPRLDPGRMSLCYLGSVNNIIDLDYMEQFLQALSDRVPVDLHLIANGEKKQEMVDRFSKIVHVIDHGLVYDPKRKQDIFNQCSFGLNLMKSSVVIGLSMKALDYLQAGLPVINSLQGDLKEWIDQQHCGININRDSLDQTITSILSIPIPDQLAMRQRAARFYHEVLSLDAFEKHLAQILDREEAASAGISTAGTNPVKTRTLPKPKEKVRLSRIERMARENRQSRDDLTKPAASSKRKTRHK